METPTPTPAPADPETVLFVERFQQAALALGTIPPDLMLKYADTHWMGRAIDWNRQDNEPSPGPDFGAVLVCLPADRIREGIAGFLHSAPENVHQQLVEAFVAWCIDLLVASGQIPDPDELAHRMAAALDALGAPPSARAVVEEMLANLGAGPMPPPAPAPTAPAADGVTVLDGESTFSQVAHRLYGDVASWVHLAKANPHHPAGMPLTPGQVLNLPK